MSSSSNEFIPVSVPSITQREVDYVTEAVESGWVSSLGKYVDLFEEEFASFCKTRHAVSCANGTVAIQLALSAYNIGANDEVLVPDLSFVATANAVLHCGAKPVFVDVDADSLCIDPELLERHITPNTRAIMPVHLYGHPANMVAINEIAREHGLVVIEDAAEAHGSSFDGQPVGGLGNCGTFSFYGNKNFTTGEGGMITTNDDQFAQRCRFLRDHAMDPKRRYWHTEPGFNYRLTNIQAALGCAQLSRADELLRTRNWIFTQYQERLGHLPELRLNRCLPGYVNSYWITCVEIGGLSAVSRDQLMVEMKKQGVDSRPYFYPMSEMPYFERANTPVSHDVASRGINLPTFVGIKEEQIERVANTFLNALQTVREIAGISATN
jgi:perosamine synthetase